MCAALIRGGDGTMKHEQSVSGATKIVPEMLLVFPSVSSLVTVT